MMMGGGMFIGLIVTVLFLVLIGGVIVGGIWLFSRGSGSGAFSVGRGPESSDEDPLEIARQRYARGDIAREEYESLREDLQT
jgi:putative membrane protein